MVLLRDWLLICQKITNRAFHTKSLIKVKKRDEKKDPNFQKIETTLGLMFVNQNAYCK